MAEYLNKNLKYLRLKQNLSQQELADKVGLDRSTISRIENNEIETTVENAIKIAKILNVSIPDFLSKDLTLEKTEISDQNAEEEQKEALRQALKCKGILDENDNITQEDFDRLMKFIDNNKDLLIKKE